MQREKPTEILTSLETAELLGLPDYELSRMRRHDKGPDWFRFGRQGVGYLRSDVTAWAKEHGREVQQ